MLDPALNSGVTESLNGTSGAVYKEKGGTGVASDGSRRRMGVVTMGKPSEVNTYARRTRRMSTTRSSIALIVEQRVG